jgi:hypothetical protein
MRQLPYKGGAPCTWDRLYKRLSDVFRSDSVTDRAMQGATVCRCRVDRCIAEEVMYGHGNQLPTVHHLRPRAVP